MPGNSVALTVHVTRHPLDTSEFSPIFRTQQSSSASTSLAFSPPALRGWCIQVSTSCGDVPIPISLLVQHASVHVLSGPHLWRCRQGNPLGLPVDRLTIVGITGADEPSEQTVVLPLRDDINLQLSEVQKASLHCNEMKLDDFRSAYLRILCQEGRDIKDRLAWRARSPLRLTLNEAIANRGDFFDAWTFEFELSEANKTLVNWAIQIEAARAKRVTNSVGATTAIAPSRTLSSEGGAAKQAATTIEATVGGVGFGMQ